jgi:hypothetical protein
MTNLRRRTDGFPFDIHIRLSQRVLYGSTHFVILHSLAFCFDRYTAFFVTLLVLLAQQWTQYPGFQVVIPKLQDCKIWQGVVALKKQDSNIS